MPSLVRGRPSASTNPAAGSRSAPPSHSLPAYEPPSQPLSKSAQRSLATLASANNERLKKHLKSASEVLGEATDNINVIATLTRQRAERTRSRRIDEGAAGYEDAGADPENGDTGLGAAEELGEKVDGLTVEIEGKLRKLIDAQARLGGRVGGLKEVVGQIERNNAESGGEAGKGTQSTLGASQFRGRRTRGVEEEEEEEEENDEDSGAHAGRQDQGSVGGGPGVPVLLKQKMEEWEKSYNAMSMGDRYASHNDYVHFRQSLHYAIHAGSDPMPPVPHASTWFRSTSDDNVTQGSQEQPYLYQRASAPAEEGGDSGSDIEAVAASINIKCPVTLLPMKNPVTSTKCPHSFEKEAIEEMIRHSPTTTGGSGRRGTNDGVKALKCPVCSVVSNLAYHFLGDRVGHIRNVDVLTT